MKITLTPEMTIAQFQLAFQSIYDHLKIEFYKHPHHQGEGSEKKEQYQHNVSFKDICKLPTNIEIDVNGETKTNDLEQYFEDTLGLHTQVFRKQMDTWLQSIRTDSLTLKDQNNKAIEASKPIDQSDLNEVDYE